MNDFNGPLNRAINGDEDDHIESRKPYPEASLFISQALLTNKELTANIKHLIRLSEVVSSFTLQTAFFQLTVLPFFLE